MCVVPFFLKFIYFKWRLITLQYCTGFAIHQHESTMGVHVFTSTNPLLVINVTLTISLFLTCFSTIFSFNLVAVVILPP